MKNPVIRVGVLHAPHISHTIYDDNRFALHDVEIGIGFHWHRRETQIFTGSLEIVPDGNDGFWAVNVVDMEDYLKSVISSEMKATSAMELLKAHAVISRSWALRTMQRKEHGHADKVGIIESPDEVRTWHDGDGHELFDVCADDHCQRYQGITRQSTDAVTAAVEATKGIVLADAEGKVCDTRFSKCCGGAMELFESCWSDKNEPYLCARLDASDHTPLPDLRNESEARKWISSSPQCFCNCSDTDVLRQVLNDYDVATTPEFFRWIEHRDVEELSDCVKKKTGINFGKIISLEPLARGTSGRITRLLIHGQKHDMIVGKELEIRRVLSPTHLRSSAFWVERGDDEGFIFHGAGWGHGVGLCQIGAAVMATSGYNFEQILSHYYPGTHLLKLW